MFVSLSWYCCVQIFHTSILYSSGLPFLSAPQTEPPPPSPGGSWARRGNIHLVLSAYILLSLCTGACSCTAVRERRFWPKESDLAADRWDMRRGRSCSWRTFLPAPGAPALPLFPGPATTPDRRRVCLGDSVRQLALSVRTHWSVQPQSATARRLRLLSTERAGHSLRPNGCDAVQKMNPVTCSPAFNS